MQRYFCSELRAVYRKDLVSRPRTQVTEVAHGQTVKLQGVVRSYQRNLTAPLGGEPCVLCEVIVRRRPLGRDVLVLSDAAEFLLEDETGVAVVSVASFLLLDHGFRSYESPGLLQRPSPAALTLLRSYGISDGEAIDVAERVLCAGQQVTKYGAAAWEAAADNTDLDYRSNARRLRICGDPVLLCSDLVGQD
jgi:hypothetical protein